MGEAQAVTTSVARIYGLSSALFAVSLAFSVIVMYDAAGVRWHAGAHPSSASHACRQIWCVEPGKDGVEGRVPSHMDSGNAKALLCRRKERRKTGREV